jgi:hypothetical protein
LGRRKPGFKSGPALFFGRFLVDSRSYTLKQAVKTMTAYAENKELATPCDNMKHPGSGSNPGGPTKFLKDLQTTNLWRVGFGVHPESKMNAGCEDVSTCLFLSGPSPPK